MRGLEASAADAFDRRLLRTSLRPVAVAFSGGGDSLALTLVADAWARQVGRELLILTVDHGLQPQSAGWTDLCAHTAARLGRPFRALPWTGAKPATGLPAAARAARHGLIADAARGAGASVILMGHTADDGLEAAAMRAAGSTTPSPREWGPSPAWPAGRGLFLLRPLIGTQRAAIRAWLADRGETWIDDPANDDLRYARSRARRAGPPCAPGAEPSASGLAAVVEEDAGGLRFSRAAARSAAADELERLLAMACVCAGGGDRRPASGRLMRLADAIRGPAPLVATLAGARIEAVEEVRIGREPGEASRSGIPDLALAAGTVAVWDGRFEITAGAPGLGVRRLAGQQARLSPSVRRRLADVPPGLRGGLPAVVDGFGEVRCPLLENIPGVEVRSLVGERLRAASGLVEREGA